MKTSLGKCKQIQKQKAKKILATKSEFRPVTLKITSPVLYKLNYQDQIISFINRKMVLLKIVFPFIWEFQLITLNEKKKNHKKYIYKYIYYIN